MYNEGNKSMGAIMIKVLELTINHRNIHSVVHAFDNEQDYLLYYNTGVVCGIWEDVDIDTAIHYEHTATGIVITTLTTDYLGIQATAYPGAVITVNGDEFVIRSPRGFYLDLESLQSFDCYTNQLPKKPDCYPVVRTREILELLEELKTWITPCYNASKSKDFGDLMFEDCPPEISDHSTYLRSSPIVISSYVLFGHFSFPKNAGSTFDHDLLDKEFGISISVINTNYRTFVGIPSIQLPIEMRGKGIYSGVIKIIKKFMNDHNLGVDIELSDSSDDGTTSRVANKHELYGDPFMSVRYGLTTM
jgi:hypothetical protein